MTPLRGFFKKILGTADKPAAPVPDRVASMSAGSPPADRGGPASDDEGRYAGRQRGSRGGRGRGRSATSDAPQATEQTRSAPRGENDAPSSRGGRGRGRGPSAGTNSQAPAATSSESRSYTWAGRGDGNTGETDEQARQRREQASRQRRSRQTSFRPYRENLDAPLPEDIAFRSGAEGGDRTILPARRRRGTGLRDTARLLVGGARSLSGWSRPIGESDEPTVSPHDEHDLQRAQDDETPSVAFTMRAGAAAVTSVTDDLDDLDATAPDADGESETGEDGAIRRRRRGRRGGRGRRRPEGVAGGDADMDAEPANAARDDDEDDEIDDEPMAAVLDNAPYAIDAALDEADDANPLEEADDSYEAPYADTDDDDVDDVDEDQDEDDEEHHEERVGLDTPDDGPARRPARQPRALENVDPSTLPQAFAELGIGERTLQALARYRFVTPTPIQVRAIPALIQGRDVVGVAQTGSGKTIAFGVPMVECLDPELAEVQGLVMVPTRELASQVLDVLKDLASGFGLEAVGILGGHSLAGDFKALERRPAIVVGTPGRVIDHLQRGTLSLRYVRYAVLDEADQMLDIGFLPDIRRILSRTPKRRQTALFSATMPSTIRRLIWQFMDNPETVTVDPELSTVDTIDQIYFEVASRDKARGLRELVDQELKGRTLIFCKMKRGVDRLEADLARQGVRVGALHGDMDQRRRERVVQEFRSGELDVLIATNVAARGLDIPEITHVVNYDVPQNPEEYVHRIGRTGRAGRDGKAITFVSEWDMREWDAIASAFGDHLRREELSIYSR